MNIMGNNGMDIFQSSLGGHDIPLQSLSQTEFDPYRDNSGTVVGMAGPNYCIIAADTRLSEGYMIRSRNICRLFEVDDGLVMSGSGCWSDLTALSRDLILECKKFEHIAGRKIGAISLAHSLAVLLYSRRSFPYFSFTILAGLDKAGVGALFRYDVLGSQERVRAVCSGKGEQLMQPMLDELTDANKNEEMWILKGDLETVVHSQQHQQQLHVTPLDKEAAVKVIYSAFKAAAEREISVGDGLQVWIIQKGAKKHSIEKRTFCLPKH
jgi:20S proteasome subunit beta 6